jgi:hypothetical protein
MEGVKGVKYAPMLPEIYENGQKTGGFPHFLAYKSPKMQFFTQKSPAAWIRVNFWPTAKNGDETLLRAMI